MSLEEMLVQGVTITGTTSLKMVDDQFVKVEQVSTHKFPLEFLWCGKSVSVEWDVRQEELLVSDTIRNESEQSGLFEILKA